MTNNAQAVEPLTEFLKRHPSLTVLTGAGCSSNSGIPVYRDDDGNWQHTRPMYFADFMASDAARKRYWARSFAAWQRMAAAQPNDSHAALAALEEAGQVDLLVTQNVDSLHRRAGSRRLVELHGALRDVLCLQCGEKLERDHVQDKLQRLNSGWHSAISGFAPDGDANLREQDFTEFGVPPCEHCGGILKPDVVFFGEAVPVDRVQQTMQSVARTDGLLIVGSSLMVFSGFRVAREAAAANKPIAIVNRGKTRADDLALVRIHGDCGDVLKQAVAAL